MLRAAASRLPRSAPRVHRSLHVGVARPSAPVAAAAAPTSKAPAAPAEPAAFDDEFQQHGEQRNKVVVALDAETVEALPVMSLDEVRACDGRARIAGASGDGDEEQ